MNTIIVINNTDQIIAKYDIALPFGQRVWYKYENKDYFVSHTIVDLDKNQILIYLALDHSI